MDAKVFVSCFIKFAQIKLLLKNFVSSNASPDMNRWHMYKFDSLT